MLHWHPLVATRHRWRCRAGALARRAHLVGQYRRVRPLWGTPSGPSCKIAGASFAVEILSSGADIILGERLVIFGVDPPWRRGIRVDPLPVEPIGNAKRQRCLFLRIEKEALCFPLSCLVLLSFSHFSLWFWVRRFGVSFPLPYFFDTVRSTFELDTPKPHLKPLLPKHAGGQFHLADTPGASFVPR